MTFEVWEPDGRLARPVQDIDRAAECAAQLLLQGIQRLEVRKLDARGRRIPLTPVEEKTLDRIVHAQVDSEVDYGEVRRRADGAGGRAGPPMVVGWSR